MLDESTSSALLGSLAEVKGALLTYTDLEVKQIEDAQREVEQLFIHLSENCTLRLFCANALLQPNPSSQPDPSNSPSPSGHETEKVSSVFYFVSRYTEPISHVLNTELHRLLSVINRLLPIGALEVHEEGVVFRYMLLSEERILDGLLALDVVRGLQQLLPAVFEWLDQLLHQPHPVSAQQLEKVKSHFQDLLTRMPILQPVHLNQLPAPHRITQRGAHLQMALALSSCLLVASLFVNATDWSTALVGSALVGCMYVLIMRLWQHQYYRQARQRKKRKQLQFSWQLLESEGIKFAYQEHVLEQHRHEIIEKLTGLKHEPVQYPSDIVRIREQTLFLRHLQSHLIQRAHQVKLKRKELQKNRTLLLQERKTLDVRSTQSPLHMDSALAGLSSEDMLLQNLLATLDYLDFKARFVSAEDDVSPVLLVKMRPLLQPLTLRWIRPWHEHQPAPEYTWMLCLDQQIPIYIPDEAWPRVREVVRLFNRFLPLGSLTLDYQRHQVALRYRFVRLRGDLSPLLVMEVMEVMATFAERLQHCVQSCLDGRVHIENILYEAEQEFLSLQGS